MITRSLQEGAASEIIGTVVLITIFVGAAAILLMVTLSQPLPGKVPAFRVTITNESRILHLSHAGGDPVPFDQVAVIVNGAGTPFQPDGTDQLWSVGETLTASSTDMPGEVRIVYTGPDTGPVLVISESLGEPSGSGLPVTTITTSPTPAPGPVTAGFTCSPTAGNVPLSVLFTDASTGPVTSWSWTFGDGNTSAVQYPVHAYAFAGEFTVGLTVSNGTGTSSLVRPAYINGTYAPALPVSAGFTGSPTAGDIPLAVQFTDTSTGPVTSWSWTFGDGNTSGAQNPLFTYRIAGTYTVSLTVSNGTGTSTQTRTGYITATSPPPAPVTAGFTGSPTSGIYPLAVQFTDASTGPVTSWSWTFGDGNTSTAQSPLYTYRGAGTYTVGLTVSNGTGSSTLTRTNYITVTTPPPVAGFTGTPTSGTAPLTVAFTDTSANSPTSWAWNFGDWGTSTLQNPSHQYTGAGTYTVSLTSTNAGGSDTATRIAYIVVTNPPPAVTGITPGTGARGTTVAITNLAGSGFQSGATVTFTISGHTVPGTLVTVVSATRITCSFPIPNPGWARGVWDVTVTNPDGQSGTGTALFTVT